MSEHSPGTQSQEIIDKFDFQFKAAVGGTLTDAAAEGAVTDTDTMMGYVKQLVTAIQLIPTTAQRGTDSAFLASVGGLLTDVASKVTDTATAIALLRYIVGVVDDAFLASVGGALDDAAAEGAVTDADTAMAYIKQLVTNSEHLVDIETHETEIFPATTGLTCTMTAHADAHTWSTWAEVVDSGATALSTAFASNDGHIAALIIEDCSEASKLYMFKLSYGASKVVIGRWRVISETNNLPVSQSSRCRGTHIPAGETIYYSAMCETAAAKTATCHIRYYLED